MPTDLWTLPFGMFGGDFRVYWNTGLAVLRGLSPYTASGSFYPPLTSYLFALTALLPPVVGYGLWGLANAAMLVHIGKGRRALAWVLFLPVLFMFLSGNIDLLAVWASQFLGRKGWKSIGAVVLICLKPQMAFVLLPFWLWKWLREDRLRLVHTGTIVFALNMLPYAIRPTVFREWVMAVRLYNTGANVGTEPGLWQFAAGHPALVLPILAVSVLIVLLAVLVIRAEPVVRAVMILAMPAGHGYDSATLAIQAPAWLMVPVSWFGAYVAWTHGSAFGHMLMPVAVIAWALYLRLREWKGVHPQLKTQGG